MKQQHSYHKNKRKQKKRKPKLTDSQTIHLVKIPQFLYDYIQGVEQQKYKQNQNFTKQDLHLGQVCQMSDGSIRFNINKNIPKLQQSNPYSSYEFITREQNPDIKLATFQPAFKPSDSQFNIKQTKISTQSEMRVIFEQVFNPEEEIKNNEDQQFLQQLIQFRKATQMNQKQREVKIIPKEQMQRRNKISGHLFPTGDLQPTRQEHDKRIRMEKGQLQQLLFRCFEKRSNWNLKDLRDYTEQPEAYLKDVLEEVAVYQRKGQDKGTYTLKPQYLQN